MVFSPICPLKPSTRTRHIQTNNLQAPNYKQIPKPNIQISNEINTQNVWDFGHCDLFVICHLAIVI
jgi:hypothetical protein